ncbi:AraC family transcriptional regulator [Pseudogemmobacter bohemicus]|nr:AraC family transcriptional regulator [Pseudogemmobacter bohemicus]
MVAAYRSLYRGGANVVRAVYIAGYASRANFSTAFSRAFGLTPAWAQDGV